MNIIGYTLAWLVFFNGCLMVAGILNANGRTCASRPAPIEYVFTGYQFGCWFGRPVK